MLTAPAWPAAGQHDEALVANVHDHRLIVEDQRIGDPVPVAGYLRTKRRFRNAAASVGARPMSLTGTDMCSAISLATLRAKPRSVLSPVVQLEVRGSGNGRASRCIK
jgi:hypothetical protein